MLMAMIVVPVSSTTLIKEWRFRALGNNNNVGVVDCKFWGLLRDTTVVSVRCVAIPVAGASKIERTQIGSKAQFK